MARAKQNKTSEPNQEINKALSDPTVEIPRFKLGEIGSIGIPIFNGVSNTELKSELNHPQSVNTYKLMSYHPSINSPLNLYNNMVSKARYRFVPPKEATEEEKKQTEIVESMFNDMDHSLKDFISEAMTCSVYGWSVCEKVFRKRTKAAGSLYDDGLIGIKKLPLRAQESIPRFVFDSSGNEVIAVEQSLVNVSDPFGRWSNRKSPNIVIPRAKFMIFNLGKNRSNPYGSSPLRDVYLPWKYLQAIEELEAMSITKDVNGMPVLKIAPQYLSADASPEQKAILENFKNMLRNMQQGSQTAAIIPAAYDPDTRQPIFDLSLLSQDGKKNFDLNKIKDYYRAMIFIGLGADILLMGTASNSGSFALGSIKNSLTNATAEYFIDRIVQVINDDLIRQLYELNGWNPARRCKFDYEDMGEESIDEIGKFIQRVASVGLMPKNIEVVNKVLTSLGLDALPENIDVQEILTDNTSRAGEGGATPFDGTRTSLGDGTNSSDLNSDNAA